jgi:hypothetical protein
MGSINERSNRSQIGPRSCGAIALQLEGVRDKAPEDYIIINDQDQRAGGCRRYEVPSRPNQGASALYITRSGPSYRMMRDSLAREGARRMLGKVNHILARSHHPEFCVSRVCLLGKRGMGVS